MTRRLTYLPNLDLVHILLPASKSIANRLLIAQALCNNSFDILNLSAAKDTQLLKNALSSDLTKIDVGMAGTAFRFLTAFYAIKGKEQTLTGAERMKKRPIKILVGELERLGAKIEYLEEEGYPPLKIKSSKLNSKELYVDGSISSQYITALLLIAPYLEKGLEICLKGKIVSLPYIDLTLKLMEQLGVSAKRNKNQIKIANGNYFSTQSIVVESDWSSAAFFYQVVAFSDQEVCLIGLTEQSMQGDRKCIKYFEKLGVKSMEIPEGILLSKKTIKYSDQLFFNMVDCPDLIPSIAVTASQLVEKTTIDGISTLRIKECDRVDALKNELKKIGIEITEVGSDRMILERKGKISKAENITFQTYNDHRMAMCLAPLAVYIPFIEIENSNVVEKSFPTFWEELKKVGISH